MSRRCPISGCQQLEAAIEAGGDLAQFEAVQTRCCELDREREPVESSDDVDDPAPLGRVGIEAGRDRPGTLDEQLDRR